MGFFRKKSTKPQPQRSDSQALVLEQNAHYRAKIQAMQSMQRKSSPTEAEAGPGAATTTAVVIANPFADTLRHQMFESLWSAVKENHLERFYSPERIEELVNKHAPFYPTVQGLCQNWNVEHLTSDFFKIVLYDVVFLCSDGETMGAEERIDDAKASIEYLTQIRRQIHGGIDGSGVKIRFVNSSYEHDNVQSSQDVDTLFAKANRTGNAGTVADALKDKIINRMIKGPLRHQNLMKPILVIVLMDEPGPHDELLAVMKDVSAETIAYSFGQVGTNSSVVPMLRALIKHNEFHIDCTENYDLVAESFQRCGAGDMAPELWISKLALGPIDASYKGLAEDD